MDEYIRQLFKEYIKYSKGSCQDFWELTLLEVTMALEAYTDKFKDEFKLSVQQNYELAQLISIAVTARLSNKNPPSLEDTYPTLFGNTNPVGENGYRPNPTDLYKEQFLDFANLHNKKRKERGELNK